VLSCFGGCFRNRRSAPLDPIERPAITDGDGAFTFRALAPGDYYVAAIDRRTGAAEDGSLENPEFLEELIANATILALREGEQASRVLRLTAR
jgi:hypothetical protein